ncbi:MAG: NUDIX domain-containing protein, partial [Ruminococcus sp.]|nr:NUDIX domain-containing protein [Ruminococcus sp.]
TLCMVEDENKNVLVQKRIGSNWTGIAFPGGYVETGKSFVSSVIREVFEETGYIIENPQLIIYSMALGKEVLAVRIITCFIMGVTAGLILRYVYNGKSFFNFEGFIERASHDTAPNLFIRLLKNIGRNFKTTGLYFLFGVLLSALFQRYVPSENFARLFGSENEGFGLLAVGQSGGITWLPMYLPILIGVCLLGAKWGMVIGI